VVEKMSPGRGIKQKKNQKKLSSSCLDFKVQLVRLQVAQRSSRNSRGEPNLVLAHIIEISDVLKGPR
jgi:hypothetical protein